MTKSQLSWVRSQHPPTQYNLRDGRWRSVEYRSYKKDSSWSSWVLNDTDTYVRHKKWEEMQTTELNAVLRNRIQEFWVSRIRNQIWLHQQAKLLRKTYCGFQLFCILNNLLSKPQTKRSRSGSGIQCTNPRIRIRYQNVTDPKHWLKVA